MNYYSENYVGGLIENLCICDFVYSSIVSVDNKGSLKNNNYHIPNYTDNYYNILKYNYIGLGSSAVKTKHLNKPLSHPLSQADKPLTKPAHTCI